MLDFIISVFVSHPYISILLGLMTLYSFFNRGRKCDLPGPLRIPIVGQLPFLNKNPYKTFMEMAKIYGPIFQIKIASRNIVVLDTLEIGQEAYNNIAFAGRPSTVSLKTIVSTGKARFNFIPADETWRFLRKVASRSLGLFASSRNSKLEAVVHDAEGFLETSLDENLDKPLNPKDAVTLAVATVIGSVLFGFEFDNKNPIMLTLVDTIHKVTNFVALGSIVDNLPFAEYLLAGKIRAFKDAIEPLNEVVENYLEKHVYNGSEDDVRDVADALVKVSEEATPAEMALIGGDKLKIRHISTDLFGAGFATTSESFRWFLNIIASNQGVQKRCQLEIDEYLSQEGREEVSLSDKGKMPYVDATMTELFRFASLVPLGIPHSMMSDTVFKGYFIPKGTTVFLNIYSIHHNEAEFPDSQNLIPERFLREDGSFNGEKAAKVVPFSMGKRRCVGESLARQELFMLFCNTILKYDIKVADGQKFDLTESIGGLTRQPHEIDLIFNSRN